MLRFAEELENISNELKDENVDVRITSALKHIANNIRNSEELLSFKIQLEKKHDGDILRVGFGAPAQNDKIVKDVEKLIEDLIKDQLPGGKILKINGPASLPVGLLLAHKFSHLYGAIAYFDPKLGKYVVSVSHDPDYPIGTLID